jgi:hypothetical protein
MGESMTSPTGLAYRLRLRCHFGHCSLSLQ